jgi:hypothetical protein
VLRAQCGDREALERLLTAVRPSLERYVRGLVGLSHAEDLPQDVLLIVYRKLKLWNRRQAGAVSCDFRFGPEICGPAASALRATASLAVAK